MIWPANTRKHGRNGSRHQAYVSYANIFVVPLVQSLPTPQTTPEPVATRDEGSTVEKPRPIPVVRLSNDSHSSNKITVPSVETTMGEVKALMSTELQAARERALASLRATRASRSQSGESEEGKKKKKGGEKPAETEREEERKLQELRTLSKAEFINFSSRRRRQFKEALIEKQVLQQKRERDMEWEEITTRVKKIEVEVREEREREERRREAERKQKIELEREIWRRENEDVVDYVWDL